jgi:ribosomal protein L29
MPLTRRNKQDLLTLLNELKTELASLRVQKIAGGSASKLTKMCVEFSFGRHCYGRDKWGG